MWALGAFAALGLGDYRRARELGAEGLKRSWQRDMKRHVGVHLQVLASLESQEGRPMRSARLGGVVEAIYESMNTVSSPVEHRIFGPHTSPRRAPDSATRRGKRPAKKGER